MTKKTIYVIGETNYYTEEGYNFESSRNIRAYEYEDDAKLDIYYWYLDRIDAGYDAEIWDGDCCCNTAFSDNDGVFSDTVYRSIIMVDMFN